jgi:hypothetical protein
MGDAMTIRRLDAGGKAFPTWRKDVTDVLLAAAVLLTLALVAIL